MYMCVHVHGEKVEEGACMGMLGWGSVLVVEGEHNMGVVEGLDRMWSRLGWWKMGASRN